ncbi:MAG: polyprenyl synthetase family protein [Deltaproteobacteria bacterium]|jgi:octaprenyl-diphosphate synthase|nr:polyprenyl synthetase family protein [Deltaproteobacteria bacterium]MBW2469349.1 polyprenyl synthetase family protein [Deltaproteobacteria bacterium]
MKDLKKRILAENQADLAEIENQLSENLKPYLDLVSEVANHILFAGGKRLRPLLLVLAAKLCGYADPYAKAVASAMEYLHAATLLHDDIIDDAVLRRGKTVAHSVYGNAVAVLVGDFLLARALAICADSGKIKVIHIISNLTENMSTGEVHQLMRKGDVTLTEEEYLEVIRRKTAVLFQAACTVSAVIAEAPPEKEQALSDYGYNLGLAFQMVDDLFDYTMDTAALGKEVGADLKEGKLTLPIIQALKQADSADRDQMVEIIHNDDFTEDEFKTLVALLHKNDGIDYTLKTAGTYIDKAKEALSIFETSKFKDSMLDIADYALARRK